MKLAEIAARLQCRLEGDGEREITGVAGLETAGPGELTFLSNPRYASLVKTTQAAGIIVGEQVALDATALPAVRSANPYLSFAQALELFYQPPQPARGVHPTAVIAPTARIGAGASIGPYAVVGEGAVIGERATLHAHVCIYPWARIGDDFTAHSHAVVREFCVLGHRVTLQNGAIIGSDGYGFARRADGSHYKIVQAGIAVLEDDVEVQAHSCVDRATVGETRIRRGAKIDNLVQVGHASSVGEDALLCAQVGIGGSSHLGKRVLMAGQAALAGHLHIGDDVVITAQSATSHDVPAGKMVSGSPAFDNKQWLRAVAAFERLPEILKSVRRLTAEVEKLKELKPPMNADERR
jgi:UDP-3-O-[3-hydroxymyristoyl] glucosamine N-acyltransferase